MTAVRSLKSQNRIKKLTALKVNQKNQHRHAKPLHTLNVDIKVNLIVIERADLNPLPPKNVGTNT
jgi:hypothetical protein